MERNILDDIVYHNVLKGPASINILKDSGYSGSVDSTPKKVKFESSKLGLPVESTCKRFRNLVEMFGPKSGECELCVYDKDETEAVTVSIPNIKMRVLKALCYEQLSISEEYSMIIAGLYYDLVKCILDRQEFMGFEITDDMSGLEKTLRKHFGECILSLV